MAGLNQGRFKCGWEKSAQTSGGLEAMVGLQIDWRTAATAFKRVKKTARPARRKDHGPALIVSDWAERSKVGVAHVLELPEGLVDWRLMGVGSNRAVNRVGLSCVLDL